MRIRTIKPTFWTNDELAELKPLTRLLFIGLWCLADVRGRLEDRPKRIKAAVLPYDDFDVDAALDELAKSGFVVRYSKDSIPVVQVSGFEKHQRITGKEAETESDFPAHTDAGVEIRAGKQRGSKGETPGTTEGKEGKEGKGGSGQTPSGSGDSQKTTRKRNDTLDALVALCGGDPMQTTPAAWSQASKALSDIRQVCPAVTPEILRQKSEAYRKAHPEWELTVSALAKHWGTLGVIETQPEWMLDAMRSAKAPAVVEVDE